MEIITRDFGRITVEDDGVFHFPEGIYGFEADTDYVLFHRDFDGIPFLYLQNTEDINPCFLVFEPGEFYAGYDPKLSKEDKKACRVNSEDELVFLTIANIPGAVENMSLNLKSPIVLNAQQRLGRQVILNNADYPIRFRPFAPDEEGG